MADDSGESCRLCGKPAVSRRFMDGPKFASMEVFYECGSALGIMGDETEFVPKCAGKPHLVCGELARQLLSALPKGHPLKLSMDLQVLAGVKAVN